MTIQAPLPTQSSHSPKVEAPSLGIMASYPDPAPIKLFRPISVGTILMAGNGGLDRSHGRSRPQKAVFWGLHFAIILLCAWLVLGGGIDKLAGWFELGRGLVDPIRAQILLACAVVYFLRHGLTLFYLLARRVDWGETFGLTAFFALFEIGLILVGSGMFRQAPIALSGLDLFAFALFLSGSYVNTASEL